jgi:hypothetical protein
MALCSGEPEKGTGCVLRRKREPCSSPPPSPPEKYSAAFPCSVSDPFPVLCARAGSLIPVVQMPVKFCFPFFFCCRCCWRVVCFTVFILPFLCHFPLIIFDLQRQNSDESNSLVHYVSVVKCAEAVK